MFPTIDKKRTGIHLRRIMDEHGFSVKDVQEYLGLGSVQSIYICILNQKFNEFFERRVIIKSR